MTSLQIVISTNIHCVAAQSKSEWLLGFCLDSTLGSTFANYITYRIFKRCMNILLSLGVMGKFHSSFGDLLMNPLPWCNEKVKLDWTETGTVAFSVLCYFDICLFQLLSTIRPVQTWFSLILWHLTCYDWLNNCNTHSNEKLHSQPLLHSTS